MEKSLSKGTVAMGSRVGLSLKCLDEVNFHLRFLFVCLYIVTVLSAGTNTLEFTYWIATRIT